MIENLLSAKKIHVGAFFNAACLEYETVMGSLVYGADNKNSDVDLYAICIPPKELLFPHLKGFIYEFDQKPQIFSEYQQHHIDYQDKKYDVFIYSITKFFRLCLDNNPNIIDSIYTDNGHVLKITSIGKKIKKERQIFLCKNIINKYIGYADSQVKRLINKKQRKQLAIPEQCSYDVKFAYHVVRLLCTAQQVLSECHIDLKKSSLLFQEIRSGTWSYDKLIKHIENQKSMIAKLETQTLLPATPNYKKVKKLLLECLEEKYGSLNGLGNFV